MEVCYSNTCAYFILAYQFLMLQRTAAQEMWSKWLTHAVGESCQAPWRGPHLAAQREFCDQGWQHVCAPQPPRQGWQPPIQHNCSNEDHVAAICMLPVNLQYAPLLHCCSSNQLVAHHAQLYADAKQKHPTLLVHLPHPCSCLNITVATADFHVEELEYRAEVSDTPETWVPLRIIKPKRAKGPLPTVIYLHATGLSPYAHWYLGKSVLIVLSIRSATAVRHPGLL